jgi:hypothetical protein
MRVKIVPVMERSIEGLMLQKNPSLAAFSGNFSIGLFLSNAGRRTLQNFIG